MDHKTFLSSLSPDEKERLTTRSDAAGLRHLCGHLAVLCVLGALIVARVPFWPLLLVPQGIVLVFLFTLQHECTHKTPFASERLNEWVGHACGVVLMQPFLWFRYFHFAHHRFTNDPRRDPERAGAEKPETWRDFVWHLSTLGYWRDKLLVLHDNATGPAPQPYTPEKARPRLRREARLMIVVYLAVLLFSVFVSSFLVWVWFVPLLLGFPFLRLYLLAEHGRCPAVADMFLNTRTTYTTALVRALAWNMPYHAEHHAYPQVPFHKLQNVNHMIRDHIGTTSEGYGAFAQEYVAGFKA